MPRTICLPMNADGTPVLVQLHARASEAAPGRLKALLATEPLEKGCYVITPEGEKATLPEEAPNGLILGHEFRIEATA